MKTKILFLGLLLSLLTVSCTKDKDDEATITADEAITNAKIDNINDDVSELSEDFTTNTEYGVVLARTSSPAAVSPWHPCNGVTTTASAPVAGVITYTRTVDYGTTPCVMPNGNLLRGKIIFTFRVNPTVPATSHTVNVSFDNFYHNAFKVEGTKTYVRTMTAATAASPSHPLVNVTLNITATNTTNGNVYTRTGNRVREFVQGFGTPQIWYDNVFKITGNWTTTHPNGNVQVASILSPVYAKFSCAYTTSTPRPSIWSEGVIQFTRGTNIATLDFGSGTCDNSAIFTINGVARTITIN